MMQKCLCAATYGSSYGVFLCCMQQLSALRTGFRIDKELPAGCLLQSAACLIHGQLKCPHAPPPQLRKKTMRRNQKQLLDFACIGGGGGFLLEGPLRRGEGLVTPHFPLTMTLKKTH
uniref:Uncharacterized protein n=1 Tax=Sphaerodactylus townsendi TaxID=933632 RepID=A0ACB8FJL6_9SAUR